MENFDVAIIGSGPGGYVAAIRCAQLGFKTALVEKYDTLGGTCLNVGCIPSKALLDSSEHYFNAVNKFSEHGIKIKDIKADMEQMIKRKAQVVKQTCDGISFLMKKNKVTVLTGHATFVDSKQLDVVDAGGKSNRVGATNFIIATGSKPSSLPGIEIDKKRIITSTEALELKTIPGHLVVIGGGVIGLELGSVYARLGAKVTVIEYMNAIIPTMDRALGKELQKVLSKEGFTFLLGHKVQSVKSSAKQVEVVGESSSGEKVNIIGDYCLVSVGRKPYTEKLGLDKAGVALDERGRIITDEKLQTNVPGIYAIGDVIKGAMLAHKAEELAGRYRNDRKPIAAISISDPSYMSCVGNDYGFNYVFSRFVEGVGNKGDVLLAISTSGNSANVLEAAKVAQAKNIIVVALTGKDGGALKNHCDVEIRVPHSGFADRTQEIHIKIIHALIDYIEQHGKNR